MEEIQTERVELTTKKPRLIQRCFIHKDSALKYEYMGSTEFEIGDQSKSLRKMFEKELTFGIQPFHHINNIDKHIQVFIIASVVFDLVSYFEVIKGLINEQWETKEPTYLNLFVKRSLGIKDEWNFSIDTEIWFDFVNGAFFTFKKENAQRLLDILGDIKKQWAEPDPPDIQDFKEKLEKVKITLRKVGKRWYSLSDVRKIDNGGICVWLNPCEQHMHNYGWFTINSLKQWVYDKGPIVMRK